MMSCERISEAFKRFKTLVLEKVNQETSQENFLLLTRLFIQNEQKNFFSLNANFSGCTSLEKLNFAKSNINNLNVDGCSSLQAVIGG
jgi:hypothetical protein